MKSLLPVPVHLSTTDTERGETQQQHKRVESENNNPRSKRLRSAKQEIIEDEESKEYQRRGIILSGVDDTKKCLKPVSNSGKIESKAAYLQPEVPSPVKQVRRAESEESSANLKSSSFYHRASSTGKSGLKLKSRRNGGRIPIRLQGTKGFCSELKHA